MAPDALGVREPRFPRRRFSLPVRDPSGATCLSGASVLSTRASPPVRRISREPVIGEPRLSSERGISPGSRLPPVEASWRGQPRARVHRLLPGFNLPQWPCNAPAAACDRPERRRPIRCTCSIGGSKPFLASLPEGNACDGAFPIDDRRPEPPPRAVCPFLRPGGSAPPTVLPLPARRPEPERQPAWAVIVSSGSFHRKP